MARPLQQAAFRRKAIYFGLILALFTLSIFWRGKLDVPFTGQVAASDRLTRLSILNQSRDLDLRELDQGDPEIAASVAQVSLVGVRGFVVTGLWYAANKKQMRNEFEEMERLVRMVTQLQPNFITPWIFQSWNIAYNVSVENDKLGDQYFYIARGIDLLAEGDRRNTKDYRDPVDGRVYRVASPDVRWWIGFYYQNKFGVSDKVQTLRSLAQVSCIPPGERKEAALTTEPPGGGPRVVDPEAFRKFCEKHPQLVRRLRTKLNCATPQSVVDFLKDNEKLPTLYKNDTDLADPTDQFPLFPPQFAQGPDEYYPSRPVDDSFDPFHAARAWFTYAQTVLPPPKVDSVFGEPLPWAAPRVGEYDPFKFRVPRSPALIIFRQLPARSQTYLAERLSKEGWFDETSTWNPDAWAGTTNQWFGNRSGDALAILLKTNTNARNEWDRAWQMWTKYGEENAQILPPGKRQQLLDAAGLTGTPNSLPPELPQEELERRGWTPRKLEAWMALVYFEQNRNVTNFAYFLESTRAERDPLTVEARKLLWAAEEARRYGREVQSARLYPFALAKWREVLATFPQFHRPGGSDNTEEATFESEIEFYRLLREDGAVRARTDRVVEAARALIPGMADAAKPDFLQAVAEDEVVARVAAESVLKVFPRLPLPATAPEKEVVRRVEEQTARTVDALAAVGSVAAAADGRTADAVRPEVVRAVLDGDFAWMKENKYEPKERDPLGRLDPLAAWVSPFVKEAVKTRLGLIRKSTVAEGAPEVMPSQPGLPPPPPPQRIKKDN